MTTLTKNKTLYEAFFAHRSLLLDATMIALSVLFLGLMSNITIPLWPVPITFQTFGVFAIAFFFGGRKGAIAILAYILAGIAGIGVFANKGSGIDAFYSVAEGIGPTGGYIVGFLVTAAVLGYYIEKGYGRTFKSVLMLLLVGEIIIYAFGLPWLWAAFPAESLWTILMWGLIPFIIGDTIKVFLAASIVPWAWKRAKKINPN